MSWKTLESKTIYDNPWITVLEDRVLNPGGGQNNYGHVRFKKTAIGIVPIDSQGNTWIVGQHRYTLSEYSWEIPMGASETGERFIETAHRELKEETGLSATSITKLMRVHTSNSITNEVGYVFVARGLTLGETSFDEMEVLKIRKLPLQEVVKMVMQGKITDAISVAAILRVNADPNFCAANTT